MPFRVCRALGLAAAAASCAAPPGAGGPEPRAAGSAVRPAAAAAPVAAQSSAAPPLRPSGPGARAYAASDSDADRAALRPDPLRVGLLDDARTLARRMGAPLPEGDARLDRAMNDLAHNLRGDDLPALEAVDFLLVHYGIAEPSPHLLLARATAGADPEIRARTLGEMAEVYRASRIARVGVGVDRAGDVMYVVVGLQEKHLELAPVPRQLPSGGGAPIRGKLETRYRDPRVVITSPDGTVKEQEAAARAGGFRGELRCAGDGRYQVEVTAVDAMGTAVLANFPVFCGVEPPTVAPRAVGVAAGAADAGAAERQMLALVNRDRAAAGLGAVILDRRLEEIARAHSRDMSEHDFVGHVSPRTGTALDRVRRAGMSPELVLENVGRAYSAEEAESGFLASPGHRANILDRRARTLGVGIVFGKPVTGTRPMFVTQLFTN